MRRFGPAEEMMLKGKVHHFPSIRSHIRAVRIHGLREHEKGYYRYFRQQYNGIQSQRGGPRGLIENRDVHKVSTTPSIGMSLIGGHLSQRTTRSKLTRSPSHCIVCLLCSFFLCDLLIIPTSFTFANAAYYKI